MKPKIAPFISLKNITRVAMKNNQQKFRFLAVGGFNTILDFSLLFIFKSLGLPILTSNILSTTIAFCFSFFANKKFTFKTSGTDVRREIILFILVTLFGLWIIQTAIIIPLTHVLTSRHLSNELALLISKLIATAVTMVWNYLLYARLVFRHNQE
jgi:putative flippase GtrA